MTQLVDEGNPHLRTAGLLSVPKSRYDRSFITCPISRPLYLSVADAQLRGIRPPAGEDGGNLDERVSALVVDECYRAARLAS